MLGSDDGCLYSDLQANSDGDAFRQGLEKAKELAASLGTGFFDSHNAVHVRRMGPHRSKTWMDCYRRQNQTDDVQ